jgi:hypothetical protein
MLPKIFHFTPLHGITRLETMEREMILFALVASRRAPNTKRADGVNITAAARWVGLSTNHLRNKLRFFAAAGQPIAVAGDGRANRSAQQHSRVVTLLKKLGCKYPPRTKGRFWNQSREELQECFDAANRIRLAKVRELRPDLRVSDEAISLIKTWQAIRRIFERRGFSLSRLRS